MNKLILLALISSAAMAKNCKFDNKQVSIEKVIRKCQHIAEAPVEDCTLFEATIKDKRNAKITSDIYFRKTNKLTDYCFNLKDNKLTKTKTRRIFTIPGEYQVHLTCDKQPSFLITNKNKILKRCN